MTLLTVKSGEQTQMSIVPFDPSNEKTKVLKKFSEIYDNYTISDVAYKFTTDMSSLTSGNITMGIDYLTSDTPPTTREQLARLTPHVSLPIKKSTSWMQVPRAMYNPNLIRPIGVSTDPSSIPFQVCALATLATKATADTIVGALHIRYAVRFSGLKP